MIPHSEVEIERAEQQLPECEPNLDRMAEQVKKLFNSQIFMTT